MPIPRHATLSMPVPPGLVRHILLDPLGLPDWNPAFSGITGPEHAAVGADYRITVRGLAGRWRYAAITPDRIDTEWEVPGLRETGSWTLAAVPGGTVGTHAFQHSGPLAVVLGHAFHGVAELRLQRLAERCGDRAGSTAPTSRGG